MLQLYNWIKIAHIISGSIIFIVTINAHIYWHLLLKQAQTNDLLSQIPAIQKLTWTIIIPFSLIQLLSGFTIISIQHYPLTQHWVQGAIVGIILVMSLWFIFMNTLSKQYQKISTPSSDVIAINLSSYRKQHLLLFTLTIATFIMMVFFMASRLA